MTFEELNKANVARTEESFHAIGRWNPLEWAACVAGECGELCNAIKKRHRGDYVPLEDIAKEIGDTAIYLDLLAHRLGVDLGECIRSAFNRKSLEIGSHVFIGDGSITSVET